MQTKAILITVLGVGLSLGTCIAGDNPELKDQKARDSYSLGYQYGETFKKQGIDIDMDLFTRAARDAQEGKKPALSPEDIDKQLHDLQKRLVTARQKARKAEAEKNLAEGTAFLAANSRKTGVETSPSGLQYKVIKEGTGESPKEKDTVTVHYRGTFIDGTEFDSSHKRGRPAIFPVNRVIKGWTEALQMMKEGAKWELYVPSDLAYGPRGNSSIPPNSTLIFDVELIAVAHAK